MSLFSDISRHMSYIHDMNMQITPVEHELTRLGKALRAAREQARLTQQDLAKRAGLTRQKLIQIEQGRPGVAHGTYEAVATWLGLQLALVPATVRLGDYAQLRMIAWNRKQNDLVSQEEALALYERNWDLVDAEKMLPEEQALLQRLIKVHGNGVLHV